MSLTYASPNFLAEVELEPDEDADVAESELDSDAIPDEEESDAVLPPEEAPAEG